MRVSTPTGLYRRAVDLLGDAGVTDLTTLIGYYTRVSAAYNVPQMPSA
jgi:4-carboxymuconolactone decarboxylase